ncbi:MAG: diacylglycerol kinase, partial [Gemmatimonadota bacterium]|nr:diacylglycerol kinase [Gemmatimonadota bacterium]
MSERLPGHRGAPIPAFVNPEAGNAADVVNALERNGAFAVHSIESAERFPDALRAAIDSGAVRIAVAGGDGTVAAAAAVVAGQPVELAVVPGGTLNHFAKDLGLPEKLEDAVRLASGGRPHPTDVGYVGDRLMLNTGSVGAYVLFVRVRDRLEQRGLPYLAASLLAFVRALVSLRSFTVVVEVEGERRVYRTPLVFVGVGERELGVPKLGGRVEGGRRGLHVIIIHGRTRTGLLLMGAALAARAVRAPANPLS